jgi:uncharacterized protein YjbI with pentapeptide repeats
MATRVNTWTLLNAARYIQVYYNQDWSVLAINPALPPKPAPPDNVSQFGIWNYGDNVVAFEGPQNSAYASARYQDNNGQVQFQGPNVGNWITQVQGDEEFNLVPTSDGNFAIYSVTWKSYLAIGDYISNPSCYPLTTKLNNAPVTLAQAARFTAFGVNRPYVLDFIEIMQDAHGLSLSGLHLQNANLSNSNLSGCDFTQAYSIADCVLDGSNLTRAKFAGISFAGISVSGANFTGANLSDCDFSEVKQWASLPVLTGANLTGATLPTGNLLSGIQASGANFTGVNLAGCDFSNANLSGANLSQLDLRKTVLTGANLSNANLSAADLSSVDLTGANLAGTNLSSIDLTTVTFPSPLTRSTDPTHLTNFAKSTLPFTVIGLDWSYLNLTSTTIVERPTSLAKLVAISTCILSADFSDVDLTGANFANATLSNANLTGANLTNTNFNGASLIGASLSSAQLNQTQFQGGALGGVEQDQAADLSYAYAMSCSFEQCNLYGVNFGGATIIECNFKSAPLSEADFSNAYLPNADFKDSTLQGVKFDGAFMVECDLTNADLSPTQSGAIVASLIGACLQGANFDGANLRGANLNNAALTDIAGSIENQYYGPNGKLTQSEPMGYSASAFPAGASFDPSSTCPNGQTYAANEANNKTIAQMMTATNPPTSWKPVGAPNLTRPR